MQHLRTFLLENPDYKLISSATQAEQDQLIRANNAHYISLRKAPTQTFVYTDFDLEQAKMWEEKGTI